MGITLLAQVMHVHGHGRRPSLPHDDAPKLAGGGSKGLGASEKWERRRRAAGGGRETRTATQQLRAYTRRRHSERPEDGRARRRLPAAPSCKQRCLPTS